MRDHHINQNKPDSERQIPYFLYYVEFILEKTQKSEGNDLGRRWE
jgi:hypothetical protein